MKIKYYLIDNQMTEDPNDYRAQVAGYETVSEDEIFDYITRKGSAITTAEVMANYREIIEAHEHFLKQGYGINTEFIKVRPAIQGVFKDKEDVFDPARHQIKFRVKLGKYYNEAAQNVKTEKVSPVNNAPLPEELIDIKSGTVNEILTPDEPATLKGQRMKFDPEDADQGIFFIAADDTETRVTKIISEKTSEIIFMVPAGLAAGNYTLEVRVLPKGNKEVKKGMLTKKLTV